MIIYRISKKMNETTLKNLARSRTGVKKSVEIETLAT